MRPYGTAGLGQVPRSPCSATKRKNGELNVIVSLCLVERFQLVSCSGNRRNICWSPYDTTDHTTDSYLSKRWICCVFVRKKKKQELYQKRPISSFPASWRFLSIVIMPCTKPSPISSLWGMLRSPGLPLPCSAPKKGRCNHVGRFSTLITFHHRMLKPNNGRRNHFGSFGGQVSSLP